MLCPMETDLCDHTLRLSLRDVERSANVSDPYGISGMSQKKPDNVGSMLRSIETAS